MSDTGGGHRASAEAIRDAFRLEFGDEYNIYVKDVWKEYTGWPLNSMESQYKFMVKHVQLWNVAFHSTSPKWIHSVYLAAITAFYAKNWWKPKKLLFEAIKNYNNAYKAALKSPKSPEECFE